MEMRLDQITTEAAMVSYTFQKHTKWVSGIANNLYEQHMAMPGSDLAVSPLPKGDVRIEPRFAVYLARYPKINNTACLEHICWKFNHCL